MSAGLARRPALVVAALMVLAAILRIPGLDAGLWFDEILTVIRSVRPPFREIVTSFPGDYAHPLYAVLAKGSVAAAGEHAWSVRLPAVVFGVATVPVLYLLASAVTSRLEALLATLLLAVSYHHVWFSQNARGYTMLAFGAVLSTFLVVVLLQRPRRGPAAAYAVVMGLGIYTHLTLAFVAAAHAGVWAASIVRERPGPQRSALLQSGTLALGGAGALSGVLYLPLSEGVLAFFTGPRLQRTAGVATPAWGVLELMRGLRVGFGTIGQVAVGVLALLGAGSYLRHNRRALWLFVLPGVITAAALLSSGAAMRPRFFFSLFGFALLLIARGASECGRLMVRTPLDSRPARIAAAVIVGLMAVASMASLPYNYRYPKQDFEGARQYVERQRAPDDLVVTAGAATLPYVHYYRTSWTPLEGSASMESLLAQRRKVWVLYTLPEYMHPPLAAFLKSRCSDRRVFPGTVGGGDVIVCTVVGTGDQ